LECNSSTHSFVTPEFNAEMEKTPFCVGRHPAAHLRVHSAQQQWNEWVEQWDEHDGVMMNGLPPGDAAIHGKGCARPGVLWAAGIKGGPELSRLGERP